MAICVPTKLISFTCSQRCHGALPPTRLIPRVLVEDEERPKSARIEGAFEMLNDVFTRSADHNDRDKWCHRSYKSVSYLSHIAYKLQTYGKKILQASSKETSLHSRFKMSVLISFNHDGNFG